MRIDFDQVIENFAGVPLKIENETVTLRYVAITALLGTPNAQDLSGEEKAHRYELAKAIHAGSADPSPDDVALIKQLVGKLFIPMIVGPAFRFLDAAVQSPAPVPSPAPAQAEEPAHDVADGARAAVEAHSERALNPGRAFGKRRK